MKHPIIDEILTEWAYRVPDGIPNPKNPMHIVHLKESLEHLNIDDEVIDMMVTTMSNNILTEGDTNTLPVKKIITMVRDTVSNKYKDFKVQTNLLSWVIPDADDTDSFEKVVKFLKGNSKIKDYVSDVKLLKPGKGNAMSPAWYSASSDGISNSFPYVGVKVKNTTDEKKDGHWLHFKLSAAKKGSSGAPRDAARYEEGIVLFHNSHRHHNGDYNKAAAKANNYGIGKISTFETYLSHMKDNFDDKKLWSSNNFGTLYHSGKGLDGAGVKGEFYTNKTPKTDIYSDSMNISVKKGKGSQLMSGKAGDAQGVFFGALQHYLNTGGDTNLSTEVSKVITEIGSHFDTITGPTGARDIKKNFGNWYIKERTKDGKLKKEAEKIRDSILKKKDLTEEDKDMLKRLTGKTTPKKNSVTWGIERHAKWEAMVADMIDKTDAMANWEIKGVTVQNRSMDNWLSEYIKTLPEELQKESKDVISLTQMHEILKDSVGDVFNKSDFKKWIVFESATGFYKFDGKASDGKSKPSSKAAADTLLVFEPGNPAKLKPTKKMDISWASGKSNGVNLNIGFKSAGTSKFSALRLLQDQKEIDDNFLLEKTEDFNTLFEYDMNKIFNEELSVLNEQISFCSELIEEMVLLEGMLSKFKSGFSKIKKLAKKIKSKLGKAIKSFWEGLKKKVIGKLVEYLKKGFEFFMDAVGLQVTAKSYSVSI